MTEEGPPQEPRPDEPDGTEAGGAGAGQPLPACGSCGAPLEDGQLYCLECGTPAPGAPGIDRGRHRAGLVVAALAAAALIGGGVGFALGQDDGDAEPPGTAAATSPESPIPPATGTAPATTVPTTGGLPPDTSVTPTAPGSTTPGVSTTPGTSTEPQDLPTSTGADTETASAEPESDWPAGRESGWTAVVSSVRSGTEATATKDRVRDAGEPAGVLFSSDFSSLKPGYWVVFSGVFASRDAAAQQARSLRPEFPGSYPRFIQA